MNTRRALALAQVGLLLIGVFLFLWQPAAAPPATSAILWLAALLAGVCALGASTQKRIDPWEALLIQAGALATATSALGLVEWHRVFKPMAMVFAIAAVTARMQQPGARARASAVPEFRLLIAALLASLAGDVLLMLGGRFIPGLLSFLLAHLAYLALFRRSGVPWFGQRLSLAVLLAYGAAMYVFLWRGGLPSALHVPVAAYVLVIALMAAQAWARQAVLRDRAALQVALGACFFVLSDTLLATNRFVQPLPWAQAWVLSTYYAAQALIVGGMLRAGRHTA